MEDKKLDDDSYIKDKKMVLKWIQSINLRTYALIIALVLIGIGFQLLTNNIYLSPRNLTLLLRQMSITGILSIGMVMIIISGHIDLSVGSLIGFCASILGILQIWHEWPVPLAIIVTLAIGALIGLWHGFLVAIMKIPAFVVTLGGLLIYRGIMLTITDAKTVQPFSKSILFIAEGFISSKYSLFILLIAAMFFLLMFVFNVIKIRKKRLPNSSFTSLLVYNILIIILLAFIGYVVVPYKGIPFPVLIIFILAFVFTLIMTRTQFGVHLYGIGGNTKAARFAGINIVTRTITVFILMGFLTAVGGIVLASRLGSAPPNAGVYLELDVIAAAIIGGTSLRGGVGTIFGGVIGALIMASIDNGMSIMNVSPFLQYIIKGSILILAVLFDISTTSKRND